MLSRDKMEIINYLGNKLAEKIRISPPAARGLLKLAIKDELGPFVPIEQIRFNDLKKVILNSLRARLIKLEIIDPNPIIEFLNDELTRNQSLITMEIV